MAISRSREVCTALCHASTSICQLLEYGCAGAGVLSEGGLGSSSNALGEAGKVAPHPCSSSAQLAQTPVQILLRRAQRMMQMDFLELLRDMAPDGLDQAEKVVGARIARDDD